MPSITKTILAVAGFATLTQAFTQPKGDPTWGALRSPDGSSQVVRGEKFTITWDPVNEPTDGKTVSLVLCKGPGGNCQLQSTAIVEGLPASQRSYEWTVPCELAPGTASTPTGYGMLVIVDGTGQYQYSTQFSIQQGSTCSGSGAVTTSGSASSGSSSSTATSASTSQTGSASTTTSPSASTAITTTATTSSAHTSVAPGIVTTTMTTSVSRTSSAGATTTVRAAATTTSSQTGAAARATHAAGALFAVGLAIFAL